MVTWREKRRRAHTNVFSFDDALDHYLLTYERPVWNRLRGQWRRAWGRMSWHVYLLTELHLAYMAINDGVTYEMQTMERQVLLDAAAWYERRYGNRANRSVRRRML
jgi:hypothetical protein